MRQLSAIVLIPALLSSSGKEKRAPLTFRISSHIGGMASNPVAYTDITDGKTDVGRGLDYALSNSRNLHSGVNPHVRIPDCFPTPAHR